MTLWEVIAFLVSDEEASTLPIAGLTAGFALENVVVLDCLWPICLAVAALVRRDNVVSRFGQRPHITNDVRHQVKDLRRRHAQWGSGKPAGQAVPAT